MAARCPRHRPQPAFLLSDRFPDGRYFVELHAHTPGQPAADPIDVLGGLLIGLGLDPRNIPDTLTGRRDLWRNRLAGKKALMVLDDAANRSQIEPLLPSGPALDSPDDPVVRAAFVAQTVVAHTLEAKVEPIFHPNSYGYRPKRSALDAVRACQQRR